MSIARNVKTARVEVMFGPSLGFISYDNHSQWRIPDQELYGNVIMGPQSAKKTPPDDFPGYGFVIGSDLPAAVPLMDLVTGTFSLDNIGWAREEINKQRKRYLKHVAGMGQQLNGSTYLTEGDKALITRSGGTQAPSGMIPVMNASPSLSGLEITQRAFGKLVEGFEIVYGQEELVPTSGMYVMKVPVSAEGPVSEIAEIQVAYDMDASDEGVGMRWITLEKLQAALNAYVEDIRNDRVPIRSDLDTVRPVREKFVYFDFLNYETQLRLSNYMAGTQGMRADLPNVKEQLRALYDKDVEDGFVGDFSEWLDFTDVDAGEGASWFDKFLKKAGSIAGSIGDFVVENPGISTGILGGVAAAASGIDYKVILWGLFGFAALLLLK